MEAKRPILRKQAEDRMKAGKSNPPVNLPEGSNTVSKGEVREQLATEAGVSGKTYDNLRTVVMKGSDELKEAVRA